MLLHKIITLIIFSLISLTFSSIVSATGCDPQSTDAVTFLKDCSQGTTGVIPGSGEGVTGVKDLVISIAEKALQFAALFAVGAIVWSGIRYTTSYGDDEKVKKAKSTAIFALIGLVLTLTAFPLVDILVNFIYSF